MPSRETVSSSQKSLLSSSVHVADDHNRVSGLRENNSNIFMISEDNLREFIL